MGRKRKEPVFDDGENNHRVTHVNVAPDGERRRIRYSAAEARRQMEFVEGLLVLGYHTGRIQVAARTTLGISTSRTPIPIKRIHARWDGEAMTRSAHARTAACRRIVQQIQNCQGRRDPANPNQWLERPNHLAIVQYEKILSNLQGTNTPVEVSVTVNASEALTRSFARYTVEQLQELHKAATLKRELANRYIQEHPEALSNPEVKTLIGSQPGAQGK